MNRRTLKITLATDAIFTSSSATIGRPGSLERITGAALLGAAAASAYTALGQEDALRAFHLGGVRFHDALPLHPTLGPALPTPFSWHERKYGSGVVDRSQPADVDGQLKQVRGGWVVEDGGTWRSFAPDTVSSMRTAIDDAGRAREGLLYGFVAVAAGASFVAWVDGDELALLDRLVGALLSRPLALGRSRGAEFGQATVEAWTASREVLEAPAPARPDRLRVLCVGDVSLVDATTGAARLLPSPEDFGLDGNVWSFDAGASFLRFRRYSPFNATRMRPDLERQVLAAGSVITMLSRSASAKAALSATRAAVAEGVGAYRSYGLGQVVVEPRLLADAEPALVRERVAADASPAPVAAPADALVAWMRRRSDEAALADRIWAAAERQAEESATWNIPTSQWGQVRAIAAEVRTARDAGAALRARLEEHLRAGVTREIWKRRGDRLLAWYADQERELGGSGAVTALEVMARRVPRHMNDTEGAHHG